jgi:hypothetical protein
MKLTRSRWERGRPVRSEREARKLVLEWLCLGCAADGTSALPAATRTRKRAATFKRLHRGHC